MERPDITITLLDHIFNNLQFVTRCVRTAEGEILNFDVEKQAISERKFFGGYTPPDKRLLVTGNIKLAIEDLLRTRRLSKGVHDAIITQIEGMKSQQIKKGHQKPQRGILRTSKHRYELLP